MFDCKLRITSTGAGYLLARVLEATSLSQKQIYKSKMKILDLFTYLINSWWDVCVDNIIKLQTNVLSNTSKIFNLQIIKMYGIPEIQCSLLTNIINNNFKSNQGFQSIYHLKS